MADDAALLDALRDVVDPELMINIVDLGLVYEIEQADSKVTVNMTLTSPACPAGMYIVDVLRVTPEGKFPTKMMSWDSRKSSGSSTFGIGNSDRWRTSAGEFARRS